MKIELLKKIIDIIKKIKRKQVSLKCSMDEEFFENLLKNPKHRFCIDKVYTYRENLIDIPFNIVLGDEDFVTWQNEAKKRHQQFINEIPITKPHSFEYVKEYENQYGYMKEYKLVYDKENPLFNSVYGGTIAKSKNYDPEKPLIIFIHGHGMVQGFAGEHRKDLFDVEHLTNQILKRGYSLWAPDNVYHDELEELFINGHNYSDMWAKVISQSFDLLKNEFPKTENIYLIGLAGGGTTGLSLLMDDIPKIKGSVICGVFFPLDLTRRDYRIKNHQFCHDFIQYGSYLPLYVMALSKPLQIQEGKEDSLWAGNKNEPNANYSGLKRPVLTEESLGPLFILEKINTRIKQSFEFHLTEHGHVTMDFEKAFDFIEKIENNSKKTEEIGVRI